MKNLSDNYLWLARAGSAGVETLSTSPHPESLNAGPRGVLIVRHGADRGRPTSFLPLLLDHIEREHKELSAVLRLHQTGDPLPSLDGIGSILFFLGDPLRLYRDCELETVAIAKAARQRGIRLLNPPGALNSTSKTRQARLWREAGIPCAESKVAQNRAELEEILDGAKFPLIMRSDHTHIQWKVFACATREQADRHLDPLIYPAAVIQFLDTRRPWQMAKPEHIMARYFHKKRSMVFPQRIFNNHIFFSDGPIVGSASSTFAAAAKGARREDHDEMIAADIEFSLAPPEEPQLMRAALRALGLDVAAIDYSSLPDGRVVLWEANPYFDLPHWSKALLSEERRLSQRNPRYVRGLAADLATLAGVSDG